MKILVVILIALGTALYGQTPPPNSTVCWTGTSWKNGPCPGTGAVTQWPAAPPTSPSWLIVDETGNASFTNPAEVIRTFLAASAALNFGTIPAGGCVNQPLTAKGADIGDRVYLGTPAELLSTPLALTYAITGPDVLTIRLCNYTSSPVTAPTWLWNVDVVK